MADKISKEELIEFATIPARTTKQKIMQSWIGVVVVCVGGMIGLSTIEDPADETSVAICWAIKGILLAAAVITATIMTVIYRKQDKEQKMAQSAPTSAQPDVRDTTCAAGTDEFVDGDGEPDQMLMTSPSDRVLQSYGDPFAANGVSSAKSDDSSLHINISRLHR